MRAIVGILLAASVGAQPVAERLRSTKPADLAWGAHLAANEGQTRYIPRIIELLKHDDWNVRTAALDALIRLQADVPTEALAPLVTGHFDAAVILLTRDVKKNGLFLTTLLERRLADWQWVALNSILSQAPPSGYSARLLREWRPRFRIVLEDSRYGPVINGVQEVHVVTSDLEPVRAMCSDGFFPTQPEFPPIAVYQLGSGENLVANGPHPVYYQVVNYAGRCTTTVSRDAYTLDYLRHLTDLTEASAPRPLDQVLVWANPAQYQREAQKLRDSLRAFIIQIRDGLVRRGRMTRQEAATLPVLDISIVDHRADQSVPLPLIDWGL